MLISLLQYDECLVTENMGLVAMAVKHFGGFGIDYEDLMQIGAIGLIKAAKNFDSKKNIKFSTYAVVKIVGEIKTYLRDNGTIKISRSLKEKKIKIERCRRALRSELGHEPHISELAARTGICADDVISALEASRAPVSLDATAEQGGVMVFAAAREEETLDKVVIAQLLAALPPLQRRLIVLRFFEDMTQAQTAKALDMSQVSVSRMERKILAQLREQIEDQPKAI